VSVVDAVPVVGAVPVVVVLMEDSSCPLWISP